MKNRNRCLSEWFSLIIECRKSGLTDIEWCRRNDIHYEAFKTAAKRLRDAAVTLPSRTKPGCMDLTVTGKPDVVKVDIVNESEAASSVPASTHPSLDPVTGSVIAVRLKGCEINIDNSADPNLVACVLRTVGRLSC